MSRPFPERVKDYLTDPTRWEVIHTEVKPSSNRRNKGGSSVDEILQHRTTGEQVVRHTVLKPDGRVFRPPHLRPYRK